MLKIEHEWGIVGEEYERNHFRESKSDDIYLCNIQIFSLPQNYVNNVLLFPDVFYWITHPKIYAFGERLIYERLEEDRKKIIKIFLPKNLKLENGMCFPIEFRYERSLQYEQTFDEKTSKLTANYWIFSYTSPCGKKEPHLSLKLPHYQRIKKSNIIKMNEVVGVKTMGQPIEISYGKHEDVTKTKYGTLQREYSIPLEIPEEKQRVFLAYKLGIGKRYLLWIFGGMVIPLILALISSCVIFRYIMDIQTKIVILFGTIAFGFSLLISIKGWFASDIISHINKTWIEWLYGISLILIVSVPLLAIILTSF